MRIDERAGLLLDAKTPQDLLFRLRFDPDENSRERNLREHGERFTAITTYTVPDFTRIFGKDTSHWDGNIDQAASKAAGVRFVFTKAMDGTVPSRYFKENKARAREVKMFEGPYHWLYPDWAVSCKLQATTLHNYLKDLPPSDLPLMEDWEWTRYMGRQANPSMTDLEIFVDQWLNLGNRKPVLYTALGYSSLFGIMPKRLRDKFAGVCPASYGGNYPLMPLGWPDWILWQFTAHAEAARFSPNDAKKLNVDLIYAFNAMALARLIGGAIPEPEPIPKADVTITIRR
jgi:GH25 family lysozyme M1 (1,4-beta-N-acetylmuramidase)